MTTELWSWLAGAIGGLLGLAAVFLIGRSTGRQRAETQQREATITAHETRAEVDDEVVGMGDDRARDELGRWVRDGQP